MTDGQFILHMLVLY